MGRRFGLCCSRRKVKQTQEDTCTGETPLISVEDIESDSDGETDYAVGFNVDGCKKFAVVEIHDQDEEVASNDSERDTKDEYRVLRASNFSGNVTLYVAGGSDKKPVQYEAQRLCPRAEEQPMHAARCPFCKGNEPNTPLDILAYNADGVKLASGHQGADGWFVRVFPNIFPMLICPPEFYGKMHGEALKKLPHSGVARSIHANRKVSRACNGGLAGFQVDALGASEVIVENTQHNALLALSHPATVRITLQAVVTRLRVLQNQPWAKQFLVFKQYGPLSGGSLVHPHTQIVTLPLLPPVLKERLVSYTQMYKSKGCCITCAACINYYVGSENGDVRPSGKTPTVTPSTPSGTKQSFFPSSTIPETIPDLRIAGNGFPSELKESPPSPQAIGARSPSPLSPSPIGRKCTLPSLSKVSSELARQKRERASGKCPCGNSYMADSIFCRKCGRARNADSAQVPGMIDSPEGTPRHIEEEPEESNQQLQEGPESRLVHVSPHFVVTVPFSSSSQYTMIIAPRRHLSHFEETSPEELDDLAFVLCLLAQAIYKGLDDPSYNIFVRTAPCMQSGKVSVNGKDLTREQVQQVFHWTVEFRPRFPADLGGFEIASGIRVVSGLPEDQAAELREWVQERLAEGAKPIGSKTLEKAKEKAKLTLKRASKQPCMAPQDSEQNVVVPSKRMLSKQISKLSRSYSNETAS